MFNELTIAYLFLGGTGAGACVVLGFLECANAGRFGALPLRSAWSAAELGFAARSMGSPRRDRWYNGAFFRFLRRRFAVPRELLSRAWPLAAGLLGVGGVCLLADVGRPDRVLGLLLNPQFSAMTVGAWSLGVSFLFSVVFSVLVQVDSPRIHPTAVVAFGVATMIGGAFALAYTGVLLQQFAAVLAFQTALVPLLFSASALSCGIAVVLSAAAFVDARYPFMEVVLSLSRIDQVLIVIEAMLLVAYGAWLLLGTGTSLAGFALALGEYASWLWVGLFVLGLAVPFVVECMLTYGSHRYQLLWVALFVLFGGALLRVCVTGLADYDVTQMPEMLFGLAGVISPGL